MRMKGLVVANNNELNSSKLVFCGHKTKESFFPSAFVYKSQHWRKGLLFRKSRLRIFKGVIRR